MLGKAEELAVEMWWQGAPGASCVGNRCATSWRGLAGDECCKDVLGSGAVESSSEVVELCGAMKLWLISASPWLWSVVNCRLRWFLGFRLDLKTGQNLTLCCNDLQR